MDDSRSRITTLGVVFLLLAGAVVVRLGYLQILRADHFSVLATQSQSRKFEIPAQRGEIFMQDRGEAVPVAMNRKLKTLYADTRYIYDQTRVVRKLGDVLGTDYTKKLSAGDGYTLLKEEVPYETAQKIKQLGLSGIGLSDNYTRVYPEGTLGARLLGFVNQDGKGQYGVEGGLDEALSGTTGFLAAETDAGGIPIPSEENVEKQARDGKDVVLTIDRNIQDLAESALKRGAQETGARSGHAVIMDPNSGRVLAMANYPTYNPNSYQKVTDYQRFRNVTVSQKFEAGSVFKPFTMAAGLDSESVTPEESYYDRGSVQVGEHNITNALGGSEPRTMTEVITNSVNTGAIYVLKQLGEQSGSEKISKANKQTLHNYFTDRFHLTEATGVKLPGEPSLSMDTPEEVSNVNYANMAFGQGITTTMLRMTSSMSAVINGGTLYKPQVVDFYREPGQAGGRDVGTQVADDSVVSEKTSEQIRAMMETVVERGGGFGARIDGYRVGGKTGTAQLPHPDGGYYEDKEIGTFIGFAPVEDPQYIMMVRMDQPTTPGFAGSVAAGPVFGDIMEQLLRYKGVPPAQ
jgi:cell division protein FtsI (penicillin-binding protein 3)